MKTPDRSVDAVTSAVAIPSYPARPVNGGDLALAGPKVGRWFVEPKYNGWRALVHVPTGTMFNRYGKRLTIEKEFATALSYLGNINDGICKIEWLDCEALERRHGIGRGTLIVLDLLAEAKQPYEVRRELMLDLFNVAAFAHVEDNVSLLCPSFERPKAETVWREAQRTNVILGATGLNEFYEGIVMKRADSVYPLQLRSAEFETPNWMKHRWTPS